MLSCTSRRPFPLLAHTHALTHARTLTLTHMHARPTRAAAHTQLSRPTLQTHSSSRSPGHLSLRDVGGMSLPEPTTWPRVEQDRDSGPTGLLCSGGRRDKGGFFSRKREGLSRRRGGRRPGRIEGPMDDAGVCLRACVHTRVHMWQTYTCSRAAEFAPLGVGVALWPWPFSPASGGGGRCSVARSSPGVVSPGQLLADAVVPAGFSERTRPDPGVTDGRTGCRWDSCPRPRPRPQPAPPPTRPWFSQRVLRTSGRPLAR